MSGILYVISTPIGNLEDITLRAINTLKTVDLIAAEDTRHTLKLLNHFNISKPLISYHKYNEYNKSNLLIEKLLSNQNIALVSDAGTPGISDPGEEIIKKAIENSISIVPIPGVCAAITAISVSGLNTSEFIFIGFLSLNNRLRKEQLDTVKSETRTIILYEAPHKLIKTLSELEIFLENRLVVIAKELTKLHEGFFRGNISEAKNYFSNPKGEYVILIEGNKKTNLNSDLINLNVLEHYNYYLNLGYKKKEIIKLIAKDRNVPKNEIYSIFNNK